MKKKDITNVSEAAHKKIIQMFEIMAPRTSIADKMQLIEDSATFEKSLKNSEDISLYKQLNIINTQLLNGILDLEELIVEIRRKYLIVHKATAIWNDSDLTQSTARNPIFKDIKKADVSATATVMQFNCLVKALLDYMKDTTFTVKYYKDKLMALKHEISPPISLSQTIPEGENREDYFATTCYTKSTNNKYFTTIYAKKLEIDTQIYTSFKKQLIKNKINNLLLSKQKTTKVKKNSFRRSGHLSDQILKYDYPKEKKHRHSIFDNLMEKTKKEIESSNTERKQITEGIKLSPSEQKIIDSLCKILHERSQTSEPNNKEYYSGNLNYELVSYGGDMKTPAPKLAFTMYELTKEYKGEEIVTGKDMSNVRTILQTLHAKSFLLSYIETTPKVGGNRIERKIEEFTKLINIIKLSETEYSKDNIELSKKEDIIILLNPIFRRQIESKFILYPSDINKRTIIANGSHTIPKTTLRLRDYLMRERSSKHYTPEINLEKLYWMLNEKWMKESRRKKVKEYTERALETCKNLRLLISYSIKSGATGNSKIVFNLNEDKDWE